jgi:VWFA-related protein
MKIVALTFPLAFSTSFVLAQVAPAPAPTPIAPAYTLRAGTQLVIVDVVVKDKHGNPVHGLTQSDFALTEGSKPQQIRNFEEHSALTPAQLAAVPPHPALPPGEFTNLVATPQTGALNIILVDVLNTAVNNQMYLRTQLLDYLKHARADSRTAIFALTTQLVQLQGFTSDPAMLLAALETKGKPKAAVYRDDLTGGRPNSEANTNGGQLIARSSVAGGGEVDPAVAEYETPINDYQQQIRAYTTLDALNQLGRSLAQIPGRKNLIWFAGDFPSEFFPSDTPAEGIFASTSALDDEFRDTVNLLSRAQIAVYPIDAQGVRSDGSNTANNANARYVMHPIDPSSTTAREGGSIAIDSHAEFTARATEHFSMQQIADDTGGSAFENSNDLSLGVSRAINDGANFYTLAYTPAGETNREGFRHIAVKVGGENRYNLSYRRGYYSEHSARIAVASKAPATIGSPLEQALRPGSPPPTQILIRVRATPLAGPGQPTVLPGNMLNPDPKEKIEGPFRVFQVSTAASVRNMSFKHGADNIIHTKVDFVTDVFDQKGNVINVQANTFEGDYKPGELQDLLHGGLTFDQRVSVPVRGEYFLRVAVHDHAGGHTGAVEIPVSTIASLPPLQESASPSALPSQPTK